MKTLRSRIIFVVFAFSLLASSFASFQYLDSRAQSTTSLTIPNSGFIIYRPNNLVLEISTSFTNAYQKDGAHLAGPGLDYLVGTTTALNPSVAGPLEYTNWSIDTNPPVQSPISGGAALKIWDTDTSQNARAEFSVSNMQKKIGNEQFVSVWYYFPSDWEVSGTWYTLSDPIQCVDRTNYYPYIEIWITKPTASTFRVQVGGRQPEYSGYPYPGYECLYVNRDGSIAQKTFNADQFPRGRWFNVQWWVRRSPNAGESFIKLWFDGALIANQIAFPYESPQPTDWRPAGATQTLNYIKSFSSVNSGEAKGPYVLTDFGYSQSYFTTYAKDYHNADGYQHMLWTDDLQVWNTNPSFS
jgi:hypothetical protein